MEKLGQLQEEGDSFHSNINTTAEKTHAQEHEELDESLNLLHEMKCHVSDLTITMKSHVQDENGIIDIMSRLTSKSKKT